LKDFGENPNGGKIGNGVEARLRLNREIGKALRSVM